MNNESLKSKILKLRNSGKTYKEIIKELGCTKSIISYHCRLNNLGGNGKDILDITMIIELNEYYKTHTVEECADRFNISKSSVTKYTENKRTILNDEERKTKNYERVKNYRQKLKEKAIDYKGGCCEKCGYDKCNWAFEFHHINPKEKDFHLASYTNLSWAKTKNELDKCILVCANCHREIHYNEYMNKFK